MQGRSLTLLDGELAVVRLDGGETVPEWAVAAGGPLSSVTLTGAETSIVCDAAAIPNGVRASRVWRAFVVAGPLDHSLTGVLASIAGPLGEAGVPIFAVSTFDTDYVLAPIDRVETAVDALRAAGHDVVRENGQTGQPGS